MSDDTITSSTDATIPAQADQKTDIADSLQQKADALKRMRAADEKPDYSRILAFKNKLHGLYMRPDKGSTGENWYVNVGSWSVDADWILFPLDDSKKNWWIANPYLARYLVNYLSLGTTKVVVKSYYRDETPAKWRFESDGNGNFRIQDEYTSEYILLYKDDGKYYVLGDHRKQSDGSDLWTIHGYSNNYHSPALKNLRKAPSNPEYGSPPQLNSFNEPVERTSLKFIGEVALPAHVVKDGDRELGWQLQQSPFYILRRYSQWNRANWKVYDGISSQKHSTTIEFGVTKTTSTEIERSLNIAITADAGFAFKGVSANMSVGVQSGLAIRTTTQWVESYFKSETFERDFPDNDGNRYAIVDWDRKDVYELLRAENGESEPDEVVLSWEVTVPNVHVADSYMAPPESRSRNERRA
ncbi:hypothetical protein [Marinactinospora rubrisoli]|uniref:Insecticidal crystal toxin domain-containing protein n=1 Tax=Marinactinospora rubrisoli TaxID=2715399 RepID=A0ABW2KIE9_9ACTN